MRRTSATALVVVALVNVVLVLAILGVHNGLGRDEADYLAKVNPSTPDLYWTDVRAWGTPLLAAPIAIFSPGLGMVRLYFAVLLSALLALAYLPWRRLLHPAVAPLAALLFATTWFTTFYGNNVMPNLPLACGCVAATGVWAGLPQSARPRRSYLLLAALVGAIALIRPSDSLLLAGPLAILTVAFRKRDRSRTLLALLAGEAIGWIPWIVESYISFGGPLARWRNSNQDLGGLHLRFVMVGIYPRLFDGTPGYCCYGHPAATAGPASAAVVAWFVGLVVLSVAGLYAAWRTRRLTIVGAALAVAGGFGLMYVGLLDYGAVRFLLPIVALLAIPVATALVWAVVAAPRAAKPAVAAGCLAVLAAHLVLQLNQDVSTRSAFLAAHRVDIRIAAQTRHYISDRACLVDSQGASTVIVAYYLRCHVSTTIDPSVSAAKAGQSGWSTVAFFDTRRPGGPFAFITEQHWARHRLQLGGRPRYVFVAPTDPVAVTGG
jgi:hypothetical protein